LSSARNCSNIFATTLTWRRSGRNPLRLATTRTGAHLLRHSIRALEARLDPKQLGRINRSAIVNLDHVRLLERRAIATWTVRLTHGTELPVSRRRRATVVRLLGDRG
jgi:DNA-binding LytR/AlgR family response regulator